MSNPNNKKIHAPSLNPTTKGNALCRRTVATQVLSSSMCRTVYDVTCQVCLDALIDQAVEAKEGATEHQEALQDIRKEQEGPVADPPFWKQDIFNDKLWRHGRYRWNEITTRIWVNSERTFEFATSMQDAEALVRKEEGKA